MRQTVNQDPAVGFDDAEFDDELDEEKQRAITAALMRSFSEQCEGADPLVAQNAVLGFAVAATHMLMYEIVAFARENGANPENAALGWLAENGKMYAERLMNAEQVRRIGVILGEPELSLKFSRQFRRRLTAR